MFCVPKDKALKMVIKSNYLLQKEFIKFYKPLFYTGPRSISKKRRKNAKSCNILGLKTPKNDLLNLKYGLPSYFTTLSSWRTT